MTLFGILFRYFARSFLLWFSVFTMGIGILIWLFNFSELLRRSASHSDISIGFVTGMSFLQLPTLIEQLLPFIFLFSAMFTLWRLNRQNEICAARAAGLSVWQFTSLLVLTALLIGLFDLMVLNPVSSSLLDRYTKLNEEYFKRRQAGIAVSKTGIWVRFEDGQDSVVVRIGKVDVKDQKVSDVTILKYDEDDIVAHRYDAKSATFVKGGLRMFGVWEYPLHKPGIYYPQLYYKSPLTMMQLQETNRIPGTLSFWQLPTFITLLHQSGLSALKYVLYWQSMIARVIWLMAMVILAATCTLRPLRLGKQFLFILPAIGLGFSLYFLRDITYAMGLSSTLPVFLAAWIPVVLSGMIGVTTLLYVEEH